MKKFYSLVLMAAALLISTSMSAKVLQGNTGADLQDAIYAIMSGSESDNLIQLSQNVDLSRTVWVGTQDIDGAYKSITIDLNGKNITWNSSTSARHEMFVLTHGELKVINTGANEAKVQLTGLHANNSRCFVVYGSYKSSRWNDAGNELSANPINTRAANGGWFSHLEIGTNVLLYAGAGCYAEGIAVDRLAEGAQFYKDASNQVKLTYGGQLFKATYGFAQGVRVDFKGKMDIVGGTADGGKVYGLTVKGNVASSLTLEQNGKHIITDKSSYGTYASNYYSFNDSIHLRQDGKTHRLDTLDAPFIYVHPGAEIKVREDGDKVTAIYAGGYAKWLVQGYAEGKTGMYASSGAIDLEDAYVKSSADSWTNPTGVGSANGGGSGVVLNSRDAYAGGIEFAVSGDTKIESVGGYAIEEAVNTTVVVPNPKADPSNPDYEEGAPATIPATNVSNITINGGTIEGGEKGAIIISGPTDAATAALDEGAKSTVVVYGGNVDGTSVIGTDGDLDDIIATGTHTTEITVTDPEDPTKTKTVVVVSEGDAPVGGNMVSNQLEDASVKWTVNTKDTIKTDLKLAELEINTDDLAQELVINEGATLEVGRVVLGKDAKIIVEAGAKFIVTGKQGIVAPVASNIVLRTSEAAQAMFLFNPAVTSNRNPNATVELISKAYRKANGQYVFQRFGVPSSSKDITRADMIYTVPTALYAFSYEENDWKSMANTDKFVPFQCYTMTTQQTEGGALYKFQCPLVGNNDAELKLQDKWNYFANSYAAPIDLKQIVNRFKESNADAVDATIYLFDEASNWWEPRNNASLLIPTNPKQIVPMQPFIIKRVGNGEDPKVKYAEHIWTPIIDPSNNAFKAPARSRQNVATVVVEIADANGLKDKVTLIEGEQFSADYDLTYDAEKYINENSFNIFANSNEAQMGIVATDNLEGMELGLNTKAQTSFTMTFCGVSNMNYAVRDMLTGTEIEIVEGATYMFSVPENTTVEGRFEIVPVAKMPTAIDNIAETAAIKGIYTVAGQFVGYNYHNLPNGIYVVDGKKIVK